MKISPRQYAQSLLEVTAEAPKGKDREYLDNFLKIVEYNNDVKLLPYIVQEIDKISDEKSGVKRATVTSAIELSGEAKKAIVKKLESVFKSKIKLNEAVNAEILGGLMIEVGDEVLDATARTMIGRFKRSLSS